jgi:hypothetical protein
MEIHTIGIDLGKTIFHLVGLSWRGGGCSAKEILASAAAPLHGEPAGARAVLQFKEKQSSGLSTWLIQLASRTHYNVVGVALANKLARIAWAVLTTGEVYRPVLVASGPHDWPAYDAWLTQAWKSHPRFPLKQPSYSYERGF